MLRDRRYSLPLIFSSSIKWIVQVARKDAIRWHCENSARSLFIWKHHLKYAEQTEHDFVARGQPFRV